MNCPYHPEQPVSLHIPLSLADGEAWMGWLEGCCGLPAWVCPAGDVHPIEARFCVHHGEERPHPERMLHERASNRRPNLIRRALELPPAPDGLSTPCIAGNVLVYLSESGRLVALDMTGESTVFLADDVLQASLRLERGCVQAALRIASGVRYLEWDVRDLRDALAEWRSVSASPASGVSSNLLGLPHNQMRLHMGAGLVRLVVEHDPVEGDLATAYHEVTGNWPGLWLIRRTENPKGPAVYDIDLRPLDLWQVPVPIPGGVLVLGAMRFRGIAVSGALVIPTVGAEL